MKTALKTTGTVLLFGGNVVTGATLLADRLRSVENYIGTGQLIVGLAGLLVALFGGALLLIAFGATDKSSPSEETPE